VFAATFENIAKTYKTGLLQRSSIPAVRNVSLSIPQGSVFGLLGPNRAGKTTLVKLLLSLTRPTSGEISRLGEPASARQSLARVGYMHENHAFPRYLSAREVLHFYGGLSGVSSEELPQRVDRLLDRVGLADRQQEPIAGFSKGMVQRLGLAQAIVNEPDLLILDEPTEGLDLQGRQLLREVVREYQKAGRTVLLISHVLPEVEALCNELAVLRNGQLAYRGSLADVTRDPQGGRRSLEAALQEVYAREVLR
jgi:ABC-2 type transport system ATP-binding protein